MDAWFDPIMSFANSPWAYLIVTLTALLDAVLPILPSESALIACGVFATVSGFSPNLFLLILAGAVGAFLGDNLTYAIGRWAEPFANKHMLSGKRGKQAKERAERWLKEHGGVMIIAGRYIPGGRTAVALVAGMTEYPVGRFRVFTAIAATTWGIYGVMLGFWGGSAFKDSPIKGIGAGLGTAAVITILIEAVRRILSARKKRRARKDGLDPHATSGHTVDV
ncbi:DedA family protein [Streptomyces sp. SID3343]|uniref:VTT domain-containing protein n=1 Tax=Streptomyces sp. SID3343 TaxID=2690260 RepID=UPI00136A8101|nr:DedA family protein [Streptomyces sp. SID3343]